MAKEFVVEMEGDSVQAVSAGVKLQKLSQITSGFLYVDGVEEGFANFTVLSVTN